MQLSDIHGTEIRDDIKYVVKLFNREPGVKRTGADEQDPMSKKAGGHTRGLAAMATIAERNAKRDGFDWEMRVYENSRDQVRLIVTPDGVWSDIGLPRDTKEGVPTQYAYPAKRLGERGPDEPDFEADTEVFNKLLKVANTRLWGDAFAD